MSADEVIAALRGVVTAVRAGVNDGLAESAEHVLEVSDKHVPRAEGDLAASGKVSTDPADLTAAVSYSEFYAAWQHENLAARHDGDQTPKYLENALNAERDDLMPTMARNIRRHLEARSS